MGGMSQKDKSQNRREERQRQICRGALKLFREKGFHSTTMREIAKASDVGLGNIYNYFSSKEDILFLVHNNILDQIYKGFDATSKAGDDPVEQLKSVIKSVFYLAYRFKDEMLFIYTETKSLERNYLHEILKRESQFVADFATLIERGVRQGVFQCENPDLAANIIVLDMVISPLRGWNIFPRYTAEELFEALIRFIFRGLGVTIDNEQAVGLE